MDTTRFNFVRLLACVCLGTVLVAGCGAPASGNTAAPKNCDPTGNSEARQACNK
jgi:hypothetical protein